MSLIRKLHPPHFTMISLNLRGLPDSSILKSVTTQRIAVQEQGHLGLSFSSSKRLISGIGTKRKSPGFELSVGCLIVLASDLEEYRLLHVVTRVGKGGLIRHDWLSLMTSYSVCSWCVVTERDWYIGLRPLVKSSVWPLLKVPVSLILAQTGKTLGR